MKVAPNAPLKEASKYTIVVGPAQGIWARSRATTYVHDVKVPNMLHGRVVRPAHRVQAVQVWTKSSRDSSRWCAGATSWVSLRKPSGAPSRLPRNWARSWTSKGPTDSQASE